MNDRPMILASGSPRRRELMTAAGHQFEIVEPNAWAECGACSGETPPQFAARMAYQKAADVATRVGKSLIIACDTIAECQGQILGKPENEDHARRMLEMLRGRKHHVYSGLCLWQIPEGQPLVEIAKTTLYMQPLTDEQIDEYLSSGLWEGKSGAFGYQDRLGWLDVLEGSESNVVGLPMELLAEMLAAVK
jgi:septum formation protein